MAKAKSLSALAADLIQQLPAMLLEESQRFPEIVQAAVAENWNNSDNPSPFSKSASDKLYKRSGDLTRALVKGKKGNIYKRSVDGGVFTATMAIDLEQIKYARVHEYGGTFDITEKQRRFFWAKYMETGYDLWKGLALAEQYTIPARPYWNKAVKDIQDNEGLALLKRLILRSLLELWNKG